MPNYAIFDIETIPNQLLPPSVIPQFDPSKVKLGNLKDPTKVAKKLLEEEQAFKDGLDKKMSLDGDLCHCCTFVGYIWNTSTEPGEDPIVRVSAGNLIEPDDELDIVINAWEFIQRAYADRIPLVTFNGIGFDIPVLYSRAIHLDVPLRGNPREMFEWLTKRWGVKEHYDLMYYLANFDNRRFKKLDDYLAMYGLETKTMDGSQVYPHWKDRHFKTILEYCHADVLATAKLFERVKHWVVKNK